MIDRADWLEWRHAGVGGSDAARAAARAAAWDAARDELNAKLTEMLLALEPAEVAS